MLVQCCVHGDDDDEDDVDDVAGDSDGCGCDQCPMFKIEEEKTVAEPLAEEAKYFTEVRLLQRDVKIVLEGASNQNLLGTVIHPVREYCLVFKRLTLRQ